MLDTLLVLVLSAHLVAANIAAAAPLVCLWLDGRQRKRGDALAGQLAVFLARQSIFWLVGVILLGGITLGVVWTSDWETFYQAARRVPASRYWWAGPELAVYLICMGGYLVLGRPSAQTGRGRVWLARLLLLVASTNLAYHFPVLFTVIGVYSTRSAELGDAFSFRAAMLEPEVVSQVVHHLLASVAVVGLVMMGFALRCERRGVPAEDVQRVAIWGGRTALVPTVLQLLAGMYVLAELPERSRDSLLGGDTLGTLLFGVSLLGAILLMHRLAAIAGGETQRRKLIGVMVLMLLVVVMMVGARHRARREMLGLAEPADNLPFRQLAEMAAIQGTTWNERGPNEA